MRQDEEKSLNQNEGKIKIEISDLANRIAASTFESDNYKEGRETFKQRRKPQFKGKW